jgi:serine/threonine-protein kinase
LVNVQLDVNQPRTESEVRGRYRSGPLVSRLTEPEGKAPAGTLLYGRLWVDEKGRAVWGRWTEAEIPGGSKVPVCLELGVNGEPYPIEEGFAEILGPGTVMLGRRTALHFVTRWAGADDK